LIAGLNSKNRKAFDSLSPEGKEEALAILELSSDPNQGMAFSRVRKDLKAEKERAAQIAQQLEDVKNNVGDPETVEQLRAEAAEAKRIREELEDTRQMLALSDYKTTDEYKMYVEEPLSRVEDFAKSMEETYNLPPGMVATALRNPDRKSQTEMLSRIVEDADLSWRDQADLSRLADDYIGLVRADEILRDDASKRLEQLQSANVSQNSARIADEERRLTKTVGSVFDNYAGSLPGFVTPDGKPTEDYNNLKEKTAEYRFDDANSYAEGVFAASVLPNVLKSYEKQAAELKNAKALLARYTKSSPSQSTNPKPKASGKKKASSSSASTFMEALDQFSLD
jgi:hypothetical protein